MEIKINKDVQEYKESIAFGLDARQFVFSSLAVACGVGSYLLLNNVLPSSIAGWLAVATAAPAGVCGFFKYNDLKLEQFLLAVLKSRFLFPQKRVFKTEETQALYDAATKKKKPATKKKAKKGA